jgi:hypothetical protein
MPRRRPSPAASPPATPAPTSAQPRRAPRRPRGRVRRGWARLLARLGGADRREAVDVVSQARSAWRQKWAAGLAGGVGGLPPFIGQAVAHGEPHLLWYHLLTVAGCMLFSMATIFAFGRATFGSAAKAAGFVAAMELAMVASELWYVRLTTLVVVVAVNMVMTGAGIALRYEAAERRREADARRQATRAQTRAAGAAARRAPASPPAASQPEVAPAPPPATPVAQSSRVDESLAPDVLWSAPPATRPVAVLVHPGRRLPAPLALPARAARAERWS